MECVPFAGVAQSSENIHGLVVRNSALQRQCDWGGDTHANILNGPQPNVFIQGEKVNEKVIRAEYHERAKNLKFYCIPHRSCSNICFLFDIDYQDSGNANNLVIHNLPLIFFRTYGFCELWLMTFCRNEFWRNALCNSYLTPSFFKKKSCFNCDFVNFMHSGASLRLKGNEWFTASPWNTFHRG